MITGANCEYEQQLETELAELQKHLKNINDDRSSAGSDEDKDVSEGRAPKSQEALMTAGFMDFLGRNDKKKLEQRNEELEQRIEKLTQQIEYLQEKQKYRKANRSNADSNEDTSSEPEGDSLYEEVVSANADTSDSAHEENLPDEDEDQIEFGGDSSDADQNEREEDIISPVSNHHSHSRSSYHSRSRHRARSPSSRSRSPTESEYEEDIRKLEDMEETMKTKYLRKSDYCTRWLNHEISIAETIMQRIRTYAERTYAKKRRTHAKKRRTHAKSDTESDTESDAESDSDGNWNDGNWKTYETRILHKLDGLEDEIKAMKKDMQTWNDTEDE